MGEIAERVMRMEELGRLPSPILRSYEYRDSDSRFGFAMPSRRCFNLIPFKDKGDTLVCKLDALLIAASQHTKQLFQHAESC